MKNFREIFEAYGADYEITMERFMGSEKMYLECLNMLFDDENMQNLEKALRSSNLQNAFEAAHTLKGVAGNMGLTHLYNAICTIVELLRKKEKRNDYLELYEAIRLEFQKVDQLRHRLAKGETL